MAASDNILYLFEDFNREMALEQACPTKLLSGFYRRHIWNLSKEFKLADNGMPSSVCKLLEMFLGRFIQDYRSTDPDSEEAREFITHLHRNMFRYIMCCFTILTKSRSKNVTLDLYNQTTFMNHFEVTCEMRMNTEYFILNMLDFPDPAMSSFDILRCMMNYMRCPPNWLTFVASVLDSAELQRSHILHKITHSPCLIQPQHGIYYLTNLHLAVAAYVASTQIYFFMHCDSDCIFSLANLLKVDIVYLDVLAQSLKELFLKPKIEL